MKKLFILNDKFAKKFELFFQSRYVIKKNKIQIKAIICFKDTDC